MAAWHSTAIVLILTLFTAAAARGEPTESGPSFFGFGREKEAAESAPAPEKRSWFGGGSADAAARDPGEPSGWDRFSDGTRRFFSNPFGMFTPKSEQPQLKGSEWRIGRPDYVRKKSSSQSSWFTGLFQPKPQKPRTVNEFLSQPRVGQ